MQDGVPMVEWKKGADLMQALVDAELPAARVVRRVRLSPPTLSILSMVKKQSDPEYISLTMRPSVYRYTLLRRGKRTIV